MAVRLDLPTEAIAELVAAARHKDNIIPSTEAAGKLSPQVGISGVARLLSEQLGTDRNELVSSLLNNPVGRKKSRHVKTKSKATILACFCAF